MNRTERAACFLALVTVTLHGCDRSPVDKQEQPVSEAKPTPPGPPPFVGSESLIHSHFSGTTGAFLFPEILGSGAALLDYDGDGDLDLYLVQGKQLDPRAPTGELLFPLPDGQRAGNRLLRNDLDQSGQPNFVDVTEAAGVGLVAYGMGVAVGDIDSDGDPDLYVTNLSGNLLYLNNGDGTFSDVTDRMNVSLPTWSTSASFLDYDRDGDLDLYVASYVNYGMDSEPRCTSAAGNQDYCGPQNFPNAQDYLLRNDGPTGFVDVSDEMGIAAVRGPGLGVTSADFDDDGYPDLFVANDGEANFLWMNKAGRSFEETGLMSGTAFNRDGSAEASMGVSVGDFDGDGDEDLFMTHLVNETNTLYVNDGSGSFSDATDRSGLGFVSKTMTGFGTAWFDMDNDGWLDLFVANGDVKVEELRESRSSYPFDQPNQLFRNVGNGRFIEIDGGAATSQSLISRGVAFGDIDNDGDTDFVVANNSGPAQLMLNQRGSHASWLRLKLVGVESNRDAYGARVAVLRHDRPPLWRRVHTDGSYLSAGDPRILVGLGEDSGATGVGVIWPSGKREIFAAPEVGQEGILVEGEGADWQVTH